MLRPTCQGLTTTRGGGIKLIRLEKNSGGCGFPRNIGLNLSRGEYISFIDGDDLLAKRALEELYGIAKKFDADVVHCEKYFEIPMDWKFSDSRKPNLRYYNCSKFVTEPTLISDDLNERVKGLQNYQFMWNVWSKMIRRDFLMKNDIKMVTVPGEDVIYTCCLALSAKRYVRVPNIINFYRLNETSITNTNNDRPIQKWMPLLIDGLDYVDKFLSGQAFFQKNLAAKYVVFDIIVRVTVGNFLPLYTRIPAFQFDEIIQKEFAKSQNLIQLTSFIFNRMNCLDINFRQQQNFIQQLQNKLLLYER